MAAVGRRSRATRSTSSSSPSSAPTRETREARTPGGAATTRTRCVWPRYGTRRPSSSAGRASSRARERLLALEVAADPGLALGEERLDERARGGPSRAAPATGSETTTPRSGWIVTRSRRARGERRSVYARSPPGSRATASVSTATRPRRSRPRPGGRPSRRAAAGGPARSPVSRPSRIAAGRSRARPGSPPGARPAARRSRGRRRSAGSNTTTSATRSPRGATPRSRRPTRAAGTALSFATAVSSVDDARARARNVPEHACRRAVGPRVGNAGVEDRVAGPAALGVRADPDPGHAHDRLEVGLGHAVDDDVDREPVVGEDVEREVDRVAPEVGREVRERSARPLGSRVAVRDDDPVPARIRRHVLPARQPSRLVVADPARVAGSRMAAHDLVGGRARGSPAAGPSRGSSPPRCTGTGRRSTSRPARRARSRRATSTSAIPHIGPRAGLEVRDLEAHRPPGPFARRPGGRDRLVDRPEHPARLVAHVRGVQRVPPGGGGDERRDLVGPGVHARGVDEAARDADRAGLERLVDVRDHRRQLGLARARGCPGRGRRCGPCRGRRGTRRSARAAAPRRRRGTRRTSSRTGRARARRGRRRAWPAQAASAARTCSRSCPTAGSCSPGGGGSTSAPSRNSVAVRVSVRVDEPGRDDVAGGVDDGRDVVVRDRSEVADGDDPVAARSPTSAGRAGRPGPVDERAAAEQEVEGHVPIVPGGRAADGDPGRRAGAQPSAITPSETRNPARRWSGGISVACPTGASPGNQRTHSSLNDRRSRPASRSDQLAQTILSSELPAASSSRLEVREALAGLLLDRPAHDVARSPDRSARSTRRRPCRRPSTTRPWPTLPREASIASRRRGAAPAALQRPASSSARRPPAGSRTRRAAARRRCARTGP